MKKIAQTGRTFMLLVLLHVCFTSSAQIGGLFTVPNDFPTLAAAINTLNLLGVAGPVTINVTAGYTETAVSGGYKMFAIPGASPSNSVLITRSGAGANPLIYAYGGGTATTASAIQDGIWWFIGTDYVTVNGIDLTDQNPTGNASMEFGFGFFKENAANGCQYNIIKNCSIQLNRNNAGSGTTYMQPGSKGILLSCNSYSANGVVVTTTVTAGSNSYNKFYANTITNCNSGIYLAGYPSGNTLTNDLNNDIGGNSMATGNTIVNFGGGNISTEAMGIYTYRQFGVNISCNTINNNNGSGVDHPSSLTGIYSDNANDASLSITSNTLSLKSQQTSIFLLSAIQNYAGASGSTNTVVISKNVVSGYTYSTALIANDYKVISSNADCRRLFMDSNLVSNVTVANGTVSILYAYASKETYVRANTISGVSGTGNRFNALQFGNTQSTTKILNNLLENISWSGSNYYMYGIYGANSYACEIASNVLRNFTYSPYGNIFGIAELSGNSSSYKLINNNQLYNFSNLPGSLGPTLITGIRLSNTSLCSPDINNNIIHSFAANTTGPGTSGNIYGLDIFGGNNVGIYRNKIANLSSTYGSDIVGVILAGSNAKFQVYNNLIGGLGFPNADVSSITGLSVSSGTCTLHYNTIYLNVSASTDPDFTSTVLWHSGTATTNVLKMNNNILVNTSIANGTGKTRVLRRNTNALTNYSVTSDNNLVYAGAPSATNLLFDDGVNTYSTLTAYKNVVSPREALSVTENPPFLTTVATATDYLSIDPSVPTQVEGLARPIAGYTADYAGTPRNAVTPDIGAWEGNYLQADIDVPLVISSGFSGGECSLTGRTFTVQLSDVSGLATGSLSPRLFYRLNLGLYTSVQGSLSSGTATNGVWTFNMSYSANANDVVRYFFTAQDASPLSNYSVFPSTGSTSSDVNNVLIPPTAPYTSTVIAPASVSVNSGILCAGSSFTLTPSGAASYTYSGGSAVVNPTSNTTYTVTGSGMAGCVTSSVAVASITVVPLPTITVNSGTLCSNQAFTLSPSGALSYNYEGGSAVVSPSLSTSYSVVGIDANGCASAPVISTVTVFTAPSLSISSNVVCSGVITTITASGASTYTWSANAGGGNSSQAAFNLNAATAYTVSGTTGSCAANYPFTVSVNPVPVFTLSASGPTLSCSSVSLTANTSTGNTWTSRAGFGGSGRQYAVAFSIGNKGYVGTGYNTSVSPSTMNDFWEYDVTTNAWTQKANFAGGQRFHAVGFAIGSKGYIGTGDNPSIYPTNDFWEYNPTTNTWTQKANFGGGFRTNATGFSIGNKGYISAGYNQGLMADVNDFWEYDPASDTWTQKTSFPGVPRERASGFSIGNKGYMGTGNAGGLLNDFYEYDPLTDAWTVKAPFGGGIAYSLAGFSVGNRGVFVTGYIGSNATNQTWEYNPANNTWVRRADFGTGMVRANACAFAVGLKGYVVTGITNSTYATDLWQYDPAVDILWSNGITQKTINPLTSGTYSVVLTNAYNCSASASQSVGILTYPSFTVSNLGGLICGSGSSTLSATGAPSYTWSANAGGSNASSVVVTPTVSSVYTVSSANGWCVTSSVVAQEVALPATQGIIASGPTTVCGGVVSLSTTATNGNTWTQRTSMSTGRTRGVAFSIGTKGYVGTGYNSTNPYLADFWEYDPAADAWTQKANFAGTPRYGAVGFSIGSKGLVGTGYDGTYTKDFWEYDPAANTWTQKNDFGGGTRRYAMGFVINGKGYLGTGWSSLGGTYTDFWEYNPASDTWLQRASLSSGLYDAAGFALNNKGYICTGADASNVPGTGLREYDPVSNTWTTKAAMGTQRAGAVAFVIGSKAYVTGGNNANDVWEYNQASNTWVARAAFPAPQRPNALSFTIGNKAYITTGGNSFLNDLWTYDQGYTISWSDGSALPVVTATSSGTYSLFLADSRGCTTTFTQNVSVTPGITVGISGPSAACLNSPVTLTATGALSYTWSANAGNATTNTVSVNPAVNTTYTVNAATSNCTATVTKVIAVNALPTVTASISNTTVCDGMPLTLSGGGASTYTWTGGVLNNTAFTPSVSGIYTVSGGDVNGCVNTATTSVTVNPSPTVTVVSGSICAGQAFNISPAGALSYTYSTGTASVVSPGATTHYSVTGFAANGCYNVTPAVATVTVHALPVISAPAGSVCIGKSFTITPSGAATYSYSSSSAVVTPTSNTSYSVGGTSTAGCVSSASAVVTISVNPVPAISVPNGTVCEGQSFTLSPSGADTYTYSGGSAVVSPAANTSYSVTGTSLAGCVSTVAAVATISVQTSPTVSVNSASICPGETFVITPTGAVTYTYSGGSATVTPAATSIYTVTGYGANGCPNAGAVTATVFVRSSPILTVNSGSVCPGGSYTLIPGGAVSYTYSGGSAVITPLSSTTVSVTGTNADGCVSTAAAVATVGVHSLPAVAISGPASVCQGAIQTLSATGAVSYTWNNGSTSSTLSISPGGLTSYTVTGTDLNSCTNTAQHTVSIGASPTLALSGNTTICNGQSTALSAAGSAITFTWSNGANGNLVSVSPSLSTVYTATGSNINGCTGTATILVFVNSLPIISANASGTSICTGNSVTLSGSGATSYTWSGGVSNNTPFYPSTTHVYTVSATDANNCTGTATTQVAVHQPPVVSIQPQRPDTLCLGESLNLTANGANTYSWSTGEITLMITVTPTETTVYSVKGTDINNCSATFSRTLAVVECTGLEELNQDRGIRIYPNPSAGRFLVQVNGNSGNLKVEVYNNLSQLVGSSDFSSGVSQLDISPYANGVYFVQIRRNGHVIRQEKIIKAE